MEAKEYQQLAKRTETPNGMSIKRIEEFQPKSTRALHACLGMAGEVGEISGAIEKWLMYQQTLDTVNLREELGDLLWYFAQMCNAMDFDMAEIMATNIQKLKHRYPDKFSSEKALEENRDREGEREILATPNSKVHPRDLNKTPSLIKKHCIACNKIVETLHRDSGGYWVCELCFETNCHKGQEPFECAGCGITILFGHKTISGGKLCSICILKKDSEPVIPKTPAHNTDCHPTCTCRVSCDANLKPMESNTRDYSRFCSVCKRNRIHNNNQAGVCPDCAADARRLNS